MKIFWISNILFPEAECMINGKGTLVSSGGWMLGAADALLQHSDNIQLYVATVSSCVNKVTKSVGQKIIYYTIPLGKGNMKYNCEYEDSLRKIYNEIEPDVVHIHGTEYSHGAAFVKACPNAKTVVSIQGLISVISRFYLAGITNNEVMRNLTIHDIVRSDSLISRQRVFEERGLYEKELLKNVRYIIGRTEWDRQHIWALNPNAKYYKCNEVLRPEFYGYKWKYEDCDKHTIFVTQASYPLKGFHKLLEAIPKVLSLYPDTKIRVAGDNFLYKFSTVIGKIKASGYQKYLYNMIFKLNLESKIEFTGPLSAVEMRHEYLKANVFVCPSSIENSPNSLGEAQILGVPCIAAYVGGIPDMIPNKSCGVLYRFEDTEMLAYEICRIFKCSDNFDNGKMQQEADSRHNPIENAKQLLKIYKDILDEA